MNTTGIAWTDKTANYQSGCTEDGRECDNCYARIMSLRLAKFGQPRYDDAVTPLGKWTRRLTFDAVAMDNAFAEMRRAKKPIKVFLGSMTDLWHEKVEESWLYALYRHIEQLAESKAPVTLQLLTKRPLLARDWQRRFYPGGLPPLVWMGTTAGNQSGWDRRVPALISINAAVKWVSMEPMLEPIRMDGIAGVDWIVVGGESGTGARPFALEWARDVVEACQLADVRVFVKQFGSQPTQFGRRVKLRHPHGGLMEEWPASLQVREWPGANSS